MLLPRRLAAAVFTAALCLVAGVPSQAANAPGPASLAVKNIDEVANPCDLNKQRMKKVGGTALGAALGFGVCRLLTEVADKKSSTSSKNKKSAACAVAGGIVGYNWAADAGRRQCELYQIAQQSKIEASFQQVTIVEPAAAQPAPQARTQQAAAPAPAPTESVVAVATLGGLSHFASGSASLTPEAHQYFTAMARQYTFEGQKESLQRSVPERNRDKALKQENLEALRQEWAEIKIVLIGHTDDTGGDALNASLSEQRSRAVAEIFRTAGIPADKLFYQGAGSSLPIADNRTEEGRSRNRRVEVIELPPGADVAEFLSLRRPNPAFFRPLPPPAPAVVAAKTPATPAAPPQSASRPAPKPSKPAVDDWDEPPASTPTRPTPTQPAKATPKPSTRPATTTAGLPPLNIDFGGSPAAPTNDAILAAMGGAVTRGSAWGFFISEAVASDETIYAVPCTRDSPELNQGLPVKQLGTDKPVYKTNEYLPGFNDTAWMGSVNGHRVGLNHVAILRRGNEPVRNPDLLVYADFDRTGDQKVDLKAATKVKIYEGQQGLLYRVFVQQSRLSCLDVVVPAGGAMEASAGTLYYERGEQFYSAPYVPGRVRAR